jgi:peptidoglycan/LPS O-acetylase OafA/YrhL
MSGEQNKKLWYLESLRGIAALMVVFTHFAGSFLPAATAGPNFPQHTSFDLWLYRTPLSVMLGGNFAVCIFFVLSGFVLTRAFFATGRLEILSRSAMKRYFRLMPPVAVAVLLAYLLIKFNLMFSHQAALVSGSSDLGALWNFPAQIETALQQAFIQAFTSGTVGVTAYNPVLWTMQVEFWGSFLVFGMAALFYGRPQRWWAWAMLVIATWQTYYLGFVLGLVLADVASQPNVREVLDRWRGWAWGGLLLLGLLLGGYTNSGATSDTWYRFLPPLFEEQMQAIATWHTLGAMLVVMSVLNWQWVQRMLSWRPFVTLGRWSFGLYLTHFLVIASFSSYLFKSLAITQGYRTSLAITFVVSLPVILIVSYLYTRWLDQPSITWANWMIRDRSKQPAADAPLVPPVAAPVIASTASVEASPALATTPASN